MTFHALKRVATNLRPIRGGGIASLDLTYELERVATIGRGGGTAPNGVEVGSGTLQRAVVWVS